MSARQRKGEVSGNFDPNSITPGTPFMEKVALWLEEYIAKKLISDPLWQGVCNIE